MCETTQTSAKNGGSACDDDDDDGDGSTREPSRKPTPYISTNKTKRSQVVQDAGYDEDYLVSNVKITLGVMA